MSLIINTVFITASHQIMSLIVYFAYGKYFAHSSTISLNHILILSVLVIVLQNVHRERFIQLTQFQLFTDGKIPLIFNYKGQFEFVVLQFTKQVLHLKVYKTVLNDRRKTIASIVIYVFFRTSKYHTCYVMICDGFYSNCYNHHTPPSSDLKSNIVEDNYSLIHSDKQIPTKLVTKCFLTDLNPCFNHHTPPSFDLINIFVFIAKFLSNRLGI